MFIPTKYAYVPFGYSGVLPYLPLCTSKSPAFENIKSSTKNPLLKPVGLSFTIDGSKTYPLFKILTEELSSFGSL